MKKAVILVILALSLIGCPKIFTPVPCATIPPPPEKVKVYGEVIIFKDPATGKEIEHRITFTEKQWDIIKQVIERKDSYGNLCNDLIGEKKNATIP
jgi:hypothetical protein